MELICSIIVDILYIVSSLIYFKRHASLFVVCCIVNGALLIPYAINLFALLSSLHNEHFYYFFFAVDAML